MASAAVVNMSASDGLGTSSFNTGVHWADGQAPSAANDYNTAGFFMRTPGNSVTNYVFAGASLTLGPANTVNGINGSILEKFSSGAGSVRFLTVNNLTNTSGAMIRSGGTAGAIIHLMGNQYTIAGNSIIQADQCIWSIDMPIVGGDNIILTNFANNANDHVAYTATNSAFTGSLYLTGAGNSAWSLEMDSPYSLPGNPSTFNPGQITFLGGGQLRDVVGCSFTNSNGGFTLAANGTINTTVTTILGEPITDMTNGVPSISGLTSSGTGTLILSNANNTYSGGTTISAGILQLGVDNAIPGNAVGGDVTVNGTLDMNGHSDTINGLNGAGAVDNTTGGSSILTIGGNGDDGSFSGNIQNTLGMVSIAKIGAGTETLTGGLFQSGPTVVAGGTLNISSAGGVPASPGDLVASSGGALNVDASSGTTFATANLTVGANSTFGLILNSTTVGINVSGNLLLQDNATNVFNYGSLTANPTAAGINAGSISAPGSIIYIVVSGSGLQTGTFTLIKYSGTALGSIANFQLV
ncbi:MAG TPA: autotransporter-associated beta strand repeat-containing protein, partial [Candidatus Polarisedimenticolia bacterium]|nr:autotransporter-associated beta strand repeat-containing protein [Candidatus Polarisedimenticolia bacterium]